MIDPVDVVITWVDGDDQNWLSLKQLYDPAVALPDSGSHHFRDWGTLQYLFRGIENYMPWVRRVHFVTWGHLPPWLNTSCARLNVVKHEDYIPEKYLPTFSSHVIELNFHRIDGLAERFVYFNDDMFVVRPTKVEDFFKQGLPRDLAALNVHCYALSRPIDLVQVRDVGVVNEHFCFKRAIRRDWKKWINPINGRSLLRTIPLLGCPRFPGFYQTHCAQPYLKSTFEEVWEAEPTILDSTCKNRLRSITDVNQWVMREWQLASGEFIPRPLAFSQAFYLDKLDPIAGARRVEKAIRRRSHSLICINDAEMDDGELLACREIVRNAFEALLPKKSAFEQA